MEAEERDTHNFHEGMDTQQVRYLPTHRALLSQQDRRNGSLVRPLGRALFPAQRGNGWVS